MPERTPPLELITNPEGSVPDAIANLKGGFTPDDGRIAIVENAITTGVPTKNMVVAMVTPTVSDGDLAAPIDLHPSSADTYWNRCPSGVIAI